MSINQPRPRTVTSAEEASRRPSIEQLLAAQGGLIEALTRGASAEESLTTLCRMVEEALPGARVVILPDLVAPPGSAGTPCFPTGQSAVLMALLRSIPLPTEPTATLTRVESDETGTLAIWVQPLPRDGAADDAGAIFALFHAPEQADESAVRDALAFAAPFAALCMAISRSKSHQQRAQDLLLRLDHWMRHLLCEMTRPDLFWGTVCAAAADLMQADLVAIPIIDPDRQTFTYHEAWGDKAPAVRGMTMPLDGGGLCGWVAQHGVSCRVADLVSDPRVIPQLAQALQVTTGVLSPLFEGERIVGGVSAFRGGRPFDALEERILNLYTGQVSAALATLQLFDALQTQKERALVTLHSIGDAVITTNESGLINYLNPVAEELTGWTPGEAFGQPFAHVIRLVEEDSGRKADDPVAACLAGGNTVLSAGRASLAHRDRRDTAVEYTVAPVRDAQQKILGAVAVLHDVSRERALTHQLAWQAAHDALTGLVNRREFEHRLQVALASAQMHDHDHALLYLDLDQFKVVNDACGHIAGDELLRQLGGMLRSRIRETDTLARLGGDEFGVLLERCPPSQAMQVAETLRQTVREFRFGWEGQHFDIGVSIGLMPITAATAGVSDALSAADVACFQAKELGRNRVHVYEPADEEVARRHGEIRWVSRISKAIAEDRLALFLQPIIPTCASAVPTPRFEVLVRLIDEDGSLVPPGAFLPAAERYNLMPLIDRWVIERALMAHQGHARALAHAGIAAPIYAINLSGTSIGNPEILEYLTTQLRAGDARPGCLCFEITETAAISQLGQAQHLIAALRELGCRFALDDFGSGLSSFGYLKQLPVDYIKIDGMFVRDLLDDPIDRAMVRSINEIGHVMGKETIAEFVETPAILEALAEIGVDYGQGFGIAAPAPIESFLDAAGGRMAAGGPARVHRD